METFGSEVTGLAEQLAASLAKEHPKGTKNVALRALLKALRASWQKKEGRNDEDGIEEDLGGESFPSDDAITSTAQTMQLVEDVSALLVARFGGKRCKTKVLLSLVKYVRTVWGYLIAAGLSPPILGVEGGAGDAPLELPDDGEELVLPSPASHKFAMARAGSGTAATAGSDDVSSPLIDLDYVRSLHSPARWGSAAPQVKLFAKALEQGCLTDYFGQYVLTTVTDVSTGFTTAAEAQFAAECAGIKGAIIMRVGREAAGIVVAFRESVSLQPSDPSVDYQGLHRARQHEPL